jgi:hypothetical protein
MEEKIRQFLNAAFAGRPLDQNLVSERIALKESLAALIKKYSDGIRGEDEVFSLAVGELRGSGAVSPEIPEFQEAKTAGLAEGSPSEEARERFDYAAFFKSVPVYIYVFFGLALIYIISAAASGLWVGLLPIILFPAYAILIYYAVRYKKNFGVFFTAYATFLFSAGYFLCFFVVAAYLELPFVSALAWPALPLAAAAYFIFDRLFFRRFNLPAVLLIPALAALSLYFQLEFLIPDVRLSWLVFPAAGAVIALILFGYGAGKARP